GLFDGPPADEELRRRLTAEAERDGPQALHDRLTRVDPVTAVRLHPNDVRRGVGALEGWGGTGRPVSERQKQWSEDRGSRIEDRESAILYPRSSILDPRCLCLDLPRAELYARIDARVRQMFADGLVEEVRSLRDLSRPLSREAAKAL